MAPCINLVKAWQPHKYTRGIASSFGLAMTHGLNNHTALSTNSESFQKTLLPKNAFKNRIDVLQVIF